MNESVAAVRLFIVCTSNRIFRKEGDAESKIVLMRVLNVCDGYGGLLPHCR
jgi:hypothetical protein